MEVSHEDDIDDFGQIIVKPGPSKRPLDNDASISDSDTSDLNTKESTIARVKHTRTRSNSVKSIVKTPQAKSKINTKQCVKRIVKNQKKNVKQNKQKENIENVKPTKKNSVKKSKQFTKKKKRTVPLVKPDPPPRKKRIKTKFYTPQDVYDALDAWYNQ